MHLARETMFAGRVLRRRGFTILEVMMASAIMAFALSSAIIVMQRALSLQDSARNITIAGQILQAEFEKMRLKDWTVVGGYEAGPTQLAANSLFGTVAGLGERFTVQRQVNTPQADMREIVLTATWRAYDGRTVSHSMKTHYGRFGLYDYYYNNGDSGAGSVEPDNDGSGNNGGGGSGQGVDNSGGPSGGGGRGDDKDDGRDNDKGDDKREGRDDDRGDTKDTEKGNPKGGDEGDGRSDDKVVIKVDDKRDGRGETSGRGDDQDDRRRSDEDDRRRDGDDEDRDGKHDRDDKDSGRDDRDSRGSRKSHGDDSDRRRSDDDERDGNRDERSKDERSDRDRRGDGDYRRNDSDRPDHDRGDHERRDDDQRGHDRREDIPRDDDQRDNDRRENDRKDDDRRDDDRREDSKLEERIRDDRQVRPGPEKEANPEVRDQRGDLKKSDAVETVDPGTGDGNVASKTDGQRSDDSSVDRKDEVPKTESRLLFRIQDLIRAVVTVVVEAVERNRSDDDSRDPKHSAEREGQEKARVDAAEKEQRGRD